MANDPYFRGLPVYQRIADEMIEFYDGGNLKESDVISYIWPDGNCYFDGPDNNGNQKRVRHVVVEENLDEGLSCSKIKHIFGLALTAVLSSCQAALRSPNYSQDWYIPDQKSRSLYRVGLSSEFGSSDPFIRTVQSFDLSVQEHGSDVLLAAGLESKAWGIDPDLGYSVLGINSEKDAFMQTLEGKQLLADPQGLYQRISGEEKKYSVTLVDGLTKQALAAMSPIDSDQQQANAHLVIWRDADSFSKILDSMNGLAPVEFVDAGDFASLASKGDLTNRVYWVTAPLTPLDEFMLLSGTTYDSLPPLLARYLRAPPIGVFK